MLVATTTWGNIGILGVDKKGAEFYQITLGGNPDHDASIGDILGHHLQQKPCLMSLKKY